MNCHCLCIYSLWSRDYWLYKVTQTAEWILYWLKCKYGLTLGSSRTPKCTTSVCIVLYCHPEEQVFFLNCWLSDSHFYLGLGDLGKWKTRKWDVDIDLAILNRGHLSFCINSTDILVICTTFVLNIIEICTAITRECKTEPGTEESRRCLWILFIQSKLKIHYKIIYDFQIS